MSKEQSSAGDNKASEKSDIVVQSSSQAGAGGGRARKTAARSAQRNARGTAPEAVRVGSDAAAGESDPGGR